MLTEFLIGGRAHAAEFAALKRRLQQVRGIHRTTRGGTGTDHRVNLVDEKDRVVVVFQLGHNRFQTFLEITTIACSGKQGAHVERIDRRALKHFGR